MGESTPASDASTVDTSAEASGAFPGERSLRGRGLDLVLRLKMGESSDMGRALQGGLVTRLGVSDSDPTEVTAT